MARKDLFEKNYPLFSKYIKEENMRSNMLENSDLLRKYNDNSEFIKDYIKEIEKHFDLDTIINLIVESIVKMPDDLMISLIKAYLISDESTKTNSNFITFFNKTSSYGIDAIKYLEEKGIVTNRSYKEIQYIVIDEKFKKFDVDGIKFKDELVREIFYDLSYPEKKYLNSLIESGSLKYLEKMFKDSNINIKYLIMLLNAKNIDASIFRFDVIKEIGESNVMAFCYLMFGTEYTAKINECVKHLIMEERFELFKDLITSGKIVSIAEISIDLLKEMPDYIVLETLLEGGYVLKRGEE